MWNMHALHAQNLWGNTHKVLQRVNSEQWPLRYSDTWIQMSKDTCLFTSYLTKFYSLNVSTITYNSSKYQLTRDIYNWGMQRVKCRGNILVNEPLWSQRRGRTQETISKESTLRSQMNVQGEACQGLGGNRLPFGVIGKMSQRGSSNVQRLMKW